MKKEKPEYPISNKECPMSKFKTGRIRRRDAKDAEKDWANLFLPKGGNRWF